MKITGTAKTMYARSSIPAEQRNHNALVPTTPTITFFTASPYTPLHTLKSTMPAITIGNTFAGRHDPAHIFLILMLVFILHKHYFSIF